MTVAAAYSKHRREDIVPLRRETASLLRQHLTHRAPAAPAFCMPRRKLVVEMLKADLAAAGIPYRDADNRVCDFHALRHTCGTLLKEAGVHPTDIQTHMRHSTITLTMDRYCHTALRDAAGIPEALPDLSDRQSQAARATGTDSGRAVDENCLASCLADRSTEQNISRQRDAAETGARTAPRRARKTPSDRRLRPSRRGHDAQAAMGFEPMNNGFAIRPLSHLGTRPIGRGQDTADLDSPGVSYPAGWATSTPRSPGGGQGAQDAFGGVTTRIAGRARAGRRAGGR